MRFPSCVFCCFPNVTNCFSTRTSCFSGRERVKTGNLSRVAFWISAQNHLQSGDNTKSFFSSKVDIHPHQKNTTGVPNNFGPKTSRLKSSFPDFEGGFPPTCYTTHARYVFLNKKWYPDFVPMGNSIFSNADLNFGFLSEILM